MPDCEHQARTMAYFDGALPAAEDAIVAAHLATCAVCQGLLGDAIALDAVVSTRVPVRARKRWPLAVAIAGSLAVAATIVLVVWPRPRTDDTIALATERAVEARFTGDRFAKHRPLGVLRGDRRVEAISLDELSKLEKRSPHDLAAALSATNDLERARRVVAALPADAASESDRAAVALVTHDFEGALAHAYRALAQDAKLTAAWWNLALAARELGVLRPSKAAFAKVAAAAEAGWADEARAQIAALDRELATETGFAAFEARARAMVAGGPVISGDDAREYPAFARSFTLDAIRVAPRERLAELRPLATELDASTSTTAMTAAIDRAASADRTVRAKFTDRYAAVVARTLTGTALEQFLDELRAAGPAVDDLRASAIILGDRSRARNAELAAIVKPWRDPWFDYLVERDRIRAAFPGDDLRAEQPILAALETCTGNAWTFRCAQLAQDLAQLLKGTGRTDQAEAWAVKAVAWFRTAGAPVHAATARAVLADTHRNLGRSALARVELEDVALVELASCGLRRYAQISLADIAYSTEDWAGVRAALATPVPPAGCTTEHEIQGVMNAADLARRTNDPADRARASQWVDAVAAGTDPLRDAVLLVARARLADAGPLATLATTAPALPRTTANDDSIRAMGFTTLVTAAGRRQAWSDVLAIANDERRAREAPCTVVVSVDDDVLTVAARMPSGVRGEQRTVSAAQLASTQLVGPEITRALEACPSIAVVARPPLHGRADILPVALPWWFTGDAPAHARGAVMRSVEVTSARAPGVTLPPLGTTASSAKFDVTLAGTAATPSRVLAALAGASYAELHAHGIAGAERDATAFLALSPDPDGRFALRAEMLRAAKLANGPIVVLAACRAAAVAPSLRARWSLPDAFLHAGAHAVVAVDIPIPDATARRVFDDLHRRLDAGEPIEAAVAAIRRSARDDVAWASHLMVFR